jgi:hypothetical protein
VATEEDKARLAQLTEQLLSYPERPLPGLSTPNHAAALAAQMVDSIRRVRYVHHIRDAEHSPLRADPSSDLFDPLRAAVLSNRTGDVDNANWLVFLATHFGKHPVDGWRLSRDVYGRLGAIPFWTWQEVSESLPSFIQWINQAASQMRADGVSRRFSNHRKYESLDHIAGVVSSYVEWVQPFGSHADMIRVIHLKVGQDPRDTFSELYHGMNAVSRFGRLAKFDHLTMLGKLGISPIEPGSPFMAGATGPLAGARLLFGVSNLSSTTADQWVTKLGDDLGLGMQVMEDSICNWQKSPTTYRHFRG